MKSKEYFGSDTETIEGKEWNWSKFTTTKKFPIPKRLLDWVIGQNHALKECFLCLDEWIHKLKYLQKAKWYKPWSKPTNKKPIGKQTLTPGPSLLLLGDPGTGKSLMGRALAEELTTRYNKNEIKMLDTLSWANKTFPGEPHISIHEAGKGKSIIRTANKKGKTKGFLKSLAFKLLIALVLGIGLTFLFLGFFNVFNPWITNGPITVGWGYVEHCQEYFNYNLFSYLQWSILSNVQVLALGATTTFSGVFLMFLPRLFGNLGNSNKGIGGATNSANPKLLVDNSKQVAPFIDATGHTSAQLYGSIAWDPYQTGGLGTPEHQRVSAGDVHRANLGILYIDEIKNLGSMDVVTLLTVLEDGQLPVTMRSHVHGADTAAMAVSTEPIPCMNFLVGAGNFDSIPQIHPALMDRLVGYGKVVRMTNEMPNTLANRRKVVQFIAQESTRFHLPPFSKDACIEIVNESRRRSNRSTYLTTKFRPLISIIKTAGTIAQNNNCEFVRAQHIKESINEHCKSINLQLLEHSVEFSKPFLNIEPLSKPKVGEIYGLYISSYKSHEGKVGGVSKIIGQLIKLKKSRLHENKGYFTVTGVKDKDATWIQASIQKVRSIILKIYNKDIKQEYSTHIDFSQIAKMDGPSAGVTMTLLLCSLIENKPIRQDVAITGEINISPNKEVTITAIGGVHEKITAAQKWGFKKIVIPYTNYKYSIDPKDYTIKVVGCKTLKDYIKEVLV